MPVRCTSASSGELYYQATALVLNDINNRERHMFISLYLDRIFI